MSPFLTLLTYLQSRTAKREDGVVALEYVILAAAVIAVIGIGFGFFAKNISDKFKAFAF